MNITLNDSEIKQAIEAYVNQSGINTDGKDVGIVLTVGRKQNGVTAQVIIESSTCKSGKKTCCSEPEEAMEPATEVDVEVSEEDEYVPDATSLFN